MKKDLDNMYTGAARFRYGPAAVGIAALWTGAAAVAGPGAVSPFGVEVPAVAGGSGGTELGGPGNGAGPGIWGAADHIISLQCEDGGWGWPHKPCPTETFHNLSGPIALGLLRAHDVLGDASILDAAVAAGDFSLLSQYGNGEARFSTFTPFFHHTLSQATGDSTYADFAAVEFFDALSAGTYGPDDFDTAGWIQSVKDARSGAWINLRPWEFSTLVQSAADLGTAGQSAMFRDAAIDGLNTLDSTDPGSVHYDILGLTGGVRGIAFSGSSTFDPLTAPNAKLIQGIDNLCDLADVLVDLQNPDGSWYWHSNLGSPGEGDKDVQTAAYAVLALLAAQDAGCGPYHSAIANGRAWIRSMQDVDGGFFSYPGGDHNIEVEAEALDAIAIESVSLVSASCETSGTLTVTMEMDAMPTLIAGGQFFLQYDNALLDLVSIEPAGAPFTQEIYESVDEGAGTIDYAVGVPGGMPGSLGPASLAVLTFDVLADSCDATDLVTFRSHTPPTQLSSLLGDPIFPTLEALQPVVLDATSPDITCPADVTVQCPEDAAPGLPLGSTSGGVAVYYNAKGPEHPSNQAFLKAQCDNIYDPIGANGGAFTFSSTSLTGNGFNWAIMFNELGQYGIDLVWEAPTSDGSVPTPALIAKDNVDNTPGGAADAGPVAWAINDYKGAAPGGPCNAATDVTNSVLRGPTPPAYDPFTGHVQVTRNDLVETATGYEAYIEGKLVSDGFFHWYHPAEGASPLSNFFLPSNDFYFSGTLTYESAADMTDGMDFYAGSMTVTAAAPSAETGFATATDNCTDLPIVSYSDVVVEDGSGCAGDEIIIERTWSAMDDCGNVSTCVQTVTVQDTTAPLVTSVPEDVTVLSDAGGCTAEVAWDAATASENCDPFTAVDIAYEIDLGDDGSIDDNTVATAYVFPAGLHRVIVIVTDACGNVNDAHSFTVEVEPVSQAYVDLAHAGMLDGPFDRCITFEFSGVDSATVEQVVSFDASGAAFGVAVSVPCGNYDCVTVRDPLHTLASSVPVTISGTTYTASVTGGDALVAGNLNDDLYIDILDFGTFVGQFGTDFGSGDTGCLVAGPHADISGNGEVDTGDFSFIQNNFLEMTDVGCTISAPTVLARGGSTVRSTPVRRITVRELHRRGMHELAVADVNRDGWLDEHDVAAFLNGAQP